ncbi:MAG: hypothetical protein AAF063_33465 [Cyanobacteria bacterium J06643_5]
MNKPSFDSMNKQELRQYMLNHRNDKEVFEYYLDKFTNPNNPVYPAPDSLADMSYIQKIFEQRESRGNS